MAKKLTVVSKTITSMTEPWCDTSAGTCHDFVDVEEFLKAKLNETVTAISSKADTIAITDLETTLNDKLSSKADLSTVSTAISNKADKSAVTALENTVSQKADSTEVTTALAKKANSADVTSALAKKADVSALDLKADKSDVVSREELDAKADKSEIISKADLALKADRTELSNIVSVSTDESIEDIDETIVATALRKTKQNLTEKELSQVKQNLGITSAVALGQNKLMFRRGVISLYSEPGVVYRNIGQVRLPMRCRQTRTFDLTANGLPPERVTGFTCGCNGAIGDRGYYEINDCISHDGDTVTISFSDDAFQSGKEYMLSARNSMRVTINISTPYIMKNSKGDFIGVETPPSNTIMIPAPELESRYDISEVPFNTLLNRTSPFKVELQKKVAREKRDIDGEVDRDLSKIYRTWSPVKRGALRLIGIYRIRAVAGKYKSEWVTFSAAGEIDNKQKITVL